MSKHTPGPWTVDAYGPDPAIRTDGGHVIAPKIWGTLDDARLIASAPDLLSSLEVLEGVMSRTIGAGAVECGDDPCLIALFNARVAIAKAKGGAA